MYTGCFTISQTKLIKLEKQLNLDYDNIEYDIRNSYNHIRRRFVKTVFNQNRINLDEVKDIYDEWRKDDEYILLRGIETYYQSNLNNEKTEKVNDFVYRFIKASKRGNDVYRYLIKQKFKQFENIEDIEFFRDEFTRKKTKILFITLTYDVKESTAIESWYKIPIMFNLFKSNLTKQYGNIKTFRVWESTKKYYAHIHCLIYFEDYEFEVFKHFSKKGKLTYRIPFYEVKKIKKYYPYEIDIQACETFQSALNEITKYVGKYLIKDTIEDKPTKTNAMIWLTNKQGYSISKGFFESIIGKEINANEPKVDDLTHYMCNSNCNVDNWEYIGLISAEDLRISGKIWVFELKKPPPVVMAKIKFLVLEKLNRL